MMCVGTQGFFVDPTHLDPLFFDPFAGFGTDRLVKKYKGEYFPAYVTNQDTGVPFVELFQTDKQTKERKGIIKIKNYFTRGGAI